MTQKAAKNDSRTRAFSIRLTDAEHKRIREIANRLESTESTVIRYAIRSMLKRISALAEAEASAFSLIPVFVENGDELISFFDLDVSGLDRVINGDTRESCNRVDTADLALLTASGLGEPHVHAKLRELKSHEVQPDDVGTMLRNYFYKKYIYGEAQSSKRVEHRPQVHRSLTKKKSGRRTWVMAHA